MQCKTIFITGASGFIGTRLALSLITQCRVAGSYLTNESIRVNGVRYYRMDVRDASEVDRILTVEKPDVVVHIAGTKDIAYCERFPDEAHEVHAIGTRNIVEACSRVGARIVYVSTDCVFPGTKEFYSEQDRTQPFNVYGTVKLEGEQAVLNAGCSTIVLRVSMLFGWYLPGQSSNTVFDVISALSTGQSIRLPNSLFNTPLFIGPAVMAIGEMALSGAQGVYHLAGKDRLTRYELGVTTAKAFGLDDGLIEATDITCGVRPRNSCLDARRLENLLDWRRQKVSQGLEMMVQDPKMVEGINVVGNSCEEYSNIRAVL